MTQMQGLRAAHEAGLTVPKQTIAKAVHYLEMCKQGDGGICYSLGSQGESRPADLGGGNLLPVFGGRIRVATRQSVPQLRAKTNEAPVGLAVSRATGDTIFT